MSIPPVTPCIKYDAFMNSSSSNKMHTRTLKLIYMHNDLLHASAQNKAIFREVRIQRISILNIIIDLLKYQNEFTYIK